MADKKAGDELESLLAQTRESNLVPLWDVIQSLVQKTPAPSCDPFLWRYQEVRPLLVEAGRLVSSEMAERRVLALDNPSLPGPGIAPTLYAGLQVLMKDEFQPPHRHAQAALRFVLEGSGAVTSVNDRSYTMEPGDLILTPSWCWHAHEKKTEGPMVWLDGLDVPLVNFLRGSFYEDTEDFQTMPPMGDDLDQAEYASGFESSPQSSRTLHSPRMRYPFGPARAALYTHLESGHIDRCHGVRRAYVNPVDGRHVLPTVAAYLQLLPASFNGVPVRTTENRMFCVVKGEGETQVGDETFTWSKNDVFVVPNWTYVSHHVDDEAILFSFSDRAALESLGLFREEQLPD